MFFDTERKKNIRILSILLDFVFIIWYNILKFYIRRNLYNMEIYLKLLGTILFVYCSIINLSSFKLQIKNIILMISLTEIISSFFLLFGHFFALIPIIFIATTYLYINTKNIAKSIAICIFSLLIILLSNYIFSFVFVYIFHINIDVLELNYMFYFESFTAGFIFIFIVSKLFGIIINQKSKLNTITFSVKSVILLLLSLILTLIIFYTNIILQPENGSSNTLIKINLILFSSYFIILMIIIYMLIKSIAKDLEYKNKQIQFENLQQYTTSLEKLYTEMKAFRHDYINIISSIVGYIDDKDMAGLEKHFRSNILPLSKSIESNNFKLGLLKNIKLPELKGVISSKLINAQELGIDVLIDIQKPIEKINMDIIELCRCIGILIDDAVEAAIKCPKPSVKITIFNKNTSVFLAIINNYADEIPSIYKMFQKGFSTKGKNRGLGLSNLKEIIEKYNNITLETSNEDGEFMQSLEVGNI